MEEKKGVIYILTNPSFPDYVKIGYADDIERRLNQLNRSECIPFAFRVYATYEVNSRLSDLKIHTIIDKLNPNLRSIDNFNGQKRVREFYAMSAEDAYSILEAIAEIHGCTDKLMLVNPNEEEIKVGAVLEYYTDSAITCTVVDDRKVEYNSEIMSLTGVAKIITGKTSGIAGPRYFKYKGAWLWDIEGRKEI